MSEDVDVDIREQVFHNAVREYIVSETETDENCSKLLCILL